LDPISFDSRQPLGGFRSDRNAALEGLATFVDAVADRVGSAWWTLGKRRCTSAALSERGYIGTDMSKRSTT
jgi:hypothetical protein